MSRFFTVVCVVLVLLCWTGCRPKPATSALFTAKQQTSSVQANPAQIAALRGRKNALPEPVTVVLSDRTLAASYDQLPIEENGARTWVGTVTSGGPGIAAMTLQEGRVSEELRVRERVYDIVPSGAGYSIRTINRDTLKECAWRGPQPTHLRAAGQAPAPAPPTARAADPRALSPVAPCGEGQFMNDIDVLVLYTKSARLTLNAGKEEGSVDAMNMYVLDLFRDARLTFRCGIAEVAVWPAKWPPVEVPFTETGTMEVDLPTMRDDQSSALYKTAHALRDETGAKAGSPGKWMQTT